MVDDLWTSTAHFNCCGWVWINNLGKTQLMGMRNLRRRESVLHSEVEVLQWALEIMLQHSSCRKFGTDCKYLISMINEPYAWPNFATELETIKTLLLCFLNFKISHFPKAQNGIIDSLHRTARSFYKKLCYIDYYVPIWLAKLLQI